MYSNVGYWYLSENDSASNLFERTQVYLQSYTQLFSTNEIKKVNLNECNRRKTSCICISSSLHVRRTHMHSLMMPNTLWHSNYVAVSFGVGSEPKFHRQKIFSKGKQKKISGKRKAEKGYDITANKCHFAQNYSMDKICIELSTNKLYGK